MDIATTAALQRASLINADIGTAESTRSGVSWGAILAGAVLAASLTLVLTVLGVGLGLSAVSPWAGAGASATAIGASAVMWLIFSEALAAGLGGYLAGRLRVKWASVHGDEVYFRDTAHGLLVWAVGVAIAAVFLSSALTSIAGMAAKTAGAAAAGAASVGSLATSTASVTSDGAGPASAFLSNATTVAPGYFTDTLLRSDKPSTDISQNARGELGRILAESVRGGSFSGADRSYAAQLIAAQTGLSQADAEQRVDTVYAKAKAAAADAASAAKDAADKARSAAAKSSIWIFVALLIGAFCASVAATIGGDQRDRVIAVP
jgi:hypothetical protein